MPTLNLSKYGIPVAVDLSGDFAEFPATAASPLQAPLVLLVDENHDPANKPAVVSNAKDVSKIALAIPKMIVVIEHFLSGETVTALSQSEHLASDFHRHLLSMVSVDVRGGDDQESLDEVDSVSQSVLDQIQDMKMAAARTGRPKHEVDKAESDLKLSGRDLVRYHPAEMTRSRSLIRSLLDQLSQNGRVGAINAGANHNSHILDNPTHDGSPICAERSAVSFVRIRPVEELRRVAAYLHWISRGRPLWEELVDWAAAVQSVQRLSP